MFQLTLTKKQLEQLKRIDKRLNVTGYLTITYEALDSEGNYIGSDPINVESDIYDRAYTDNYDDQKKRGHKLRVLKNLYEKFHAARLGV